MSFKINSLYLTDGYKVGHKKMLAPGTTKLYGTWIPRSIKHAPEGVTKIVSFGQQLVWKWLHDEFEENFFSDRTDYALFEIEHDAIKQKALQFVKDMSLYLGMEYDGKHFEELWNLGYLPIKVKALPEGIETGTNIPHMTFVNTVDGFAWLALYLETIVSSLAWKPSTAATIARLYRKQAVEWVSKTDPANIGLVDFMCHDFSARGLDPMSQYLIGLGHATSFKGSDTLPVIPASRYFYGVKEDEMPIFSVNASEHSVSTTKIFTVGEKQMLLDWLKIFPQGMLSWVIDTFSTWDAIKYAAECKDEIMARDGKLVFRPDSGDPVDIICGTDKIVQKKSQMNYLDEWLCLEDGKRYHDAGSSHNHRHEEWIIESTDIKPSRKGVIELLWDIFGGTINEQGFKVLDPHIGAIYGDSITPERQIQIYERLAAKGFAATNIVLGVGSFTYQYNTRDTLGFAAKGAWFEVEENVEFISLMSEDEPFIFSAKTSYNIYKDPITDDGTKKSLKGKVAVLQKDNGEYFTIQECNDEDENSGVLQVIYEDGKFFNLTTLEEVRAKLLKNG
jgi:nicotinamide phosphoribosyltransferase